MLGDNYLSAIIPFSFFIFLIFQFCQVSDTLDRLLVRQSYNKEMRPLPADGGPVTVEINMAVRSIGPIDEVRRLA